MLTASGTQDQDNLAPDGGPLLPLMGCGSAQSTGQIMADDAAQAFNRFGPRATPNWGFEQGLAYWTPVSTGTSPFAYQGSTAAYLNSGGNISTRVRIAESGNYRYTVRYQATSGSFSGNVLFRAWVGTVDYASTPIPGQGCPNLNNFTEQTGGQVTTPVNTTRVPTTSWALFSQNLGSIPAEGLHIRIEVINNTTTQLRIDNFALEEL